MMIYRQYTKNVVVLYTMDTQLRFHTIDGMILSKGREIFSSIQVFSVPPKYKFI